MDWSLFWTAFAAIGGTFGTVTGVIALVQTRKANKLAKDANAIARKANRVAGEANGLAAHANEIGEHANLIAQRALMAGSDQTGYPWAAEFDADRAELAVIDDCGVDAYDVRVTVRLEGKTIGEGLREHLPGMKEIPLHVPLLLEKLHEENSRFRRSGMIGSPYVKASIGIVWTSELGVHRSLESEQGFGYTKRKKILS